MIQIKRFFTIIELLAVIGIIMVLAGLLFPAMKKAQENARSTYCKNNLHSLGTAIQSYLQDSKDLMPNAAQMPSKKLNSDPSLWELMEGRLSTQKALKCPSDLPGKVWYEITETETGYSGGDSTQNPIDYYNSTYYDREGSSYEYNAMLGGRQLKDMRFVRRFGETRVWVSKDFAPFHGKSGAVGACNFLFSDWHVGDIK